MRLTVLRVVIEIKRLGWVALFFGADKHKDVAKWCDVVMPCVITKHAPCSCLYANPFDSSMRFGEITSMSRRFTWMSRWIGLLRWPSGGRAVGRRYQWLLMRTKSICLSAVIAPTRCWRPCHLWYSDSASLLVSNLSYRWVNWHSPAWHVFDRSNSSTKHNSSVAPDISGSLAVRQGHVWSHSWDLDCINGL